MITGQLFKLSKQIDVAINRLNNHIMLELVFEAGTRRLTDIREQIHFTFPDGKPYARFDAANEIWNEINTFVSIDDINLEFEYNKALDKENEYTKLSNNLLRSRSETAYELIKYGLSRYEGEHPFSLNLLAKDENDIPLKYEENRVALDGYPNRYELQCATIRTNYPNFLSPINLATLLYTSTSQFLDTASATPQVEIPIIQLINFDIAFALAQLEKQVNVKRYSVIEVRSNRELFDLDKFQLYLQHTKIENTFLLSQISKNASEIIRINNIDFLEFEGEQNTTDPSKQYKIRGKDFIAVTQSKRALDDFYKENPKRFLSQDFAHKADCILGIIQAAYPELNERIELHTNQQQIEEQTIFVSDNVTGRIYKNMGLRYIVDGYKDQFELLEKQAIPENASDTRIAAFLFKMYEEGYIKQDKHNVQRVKDLAHERYGINKNRTSVFDVTKKSDREAHLKNKVKGMSAINTLFEGY